MILKKLIFLFVLLWFFKCLSASEINGRIQIEGDWKPVVFLASLNSPENLFVASPDFVVAQSLINPDGTFSISTENIPGEPRFYRRYMVKGELSSVEFSSAKNKNYIHLLLQRGVQLEFTALAKNEKLSVIEIKGSNENKTLQNFDDGFSAWKLQYTSEITKAKSNFLNRELLDYIRNFVDSTRYSLVGLYALYHIDDKQTDFLQNNDFYFSFQKRLEKQPPGSIYLKAYSELLNDLVGFREMVCEIPGVGPKWKDQLLIAQGILIFILLLVLLRLTVGSRKQNSKNILQKDLDKTFDHLTSKEKEILQLLAQGKSNKEIATELFVELSTVKTHINSIYKQLKLSGRKDAIDYYNSISRGV